MKILMVAPESVPFIKVGGLADAVGALTRSLSSRGHDVRIVLPKYHKLRHFESASPINNPYLRVRLGVEDAHAHIWETGYPESSARVYFIEYEMFFGSGDVYCGPSGSELDNGYRFGFLSRAALDLCEHLQWFPDVVHCHDWTTGLVPAFLNTVDLNTNLGRSASVLTVHNLQHQGYCPQSVLKYAGIPNSLFRKDGFESYGQVNLLKGGIYHSTKITTVSPSYAKEIQTDRYGCGLESVIRFRSADLIGVINGIDLLEWNPRTDSQIIENFSLDNLSGKAACKSDLQKLCKLEEDSDCPLFVIVSRLYEQKGLDLLIAVADRLMNETSLQIAVLGAGDAGLEEAFVNLAERYSKRFATVLEFDNTLAHKMIAGGDFLLMPSRFEPCGLSQMYAMQYGTIPVVRKTGGLKDSVRVCSENWADGNGFSFSEIDSGQLYETVHTACQYFFENKDGIRAMQEKGMTEDFSWTSSAEQYERLFHWAMEARQGAFA